MPSEGSYITDEMRAMIGKVLGSWTSGEEICRSEIRRYTQAVMDDNPLYYDEGYAKKAGFGGIVAPGVFPTRCRRRLAGSPDPLNDARRDRDDAITDRALEQCLKLWPPHMKEFNAGSELEVFQRARPGDIISARDVLVDIFERTGTRGRLGFFVIETTYTNQKGEVLCLDRQFHAMREEPTDRN